MAEILDKGLAALQPDIAEDARRSHIKRIVEQGLCADVLARPADDYTRALLAAMPRIARSG